MVLVRVLALAAGASALAARNVKVDGQKFVVAATGEEIVLSGPNVVVKGPPWLPSVAGEGLRRPRARLPLTRGAFIARPRGVLTTPMNLHLNLPLPLGDAILSTSASTTAVINDSSNTETFGKESMTNQIGSTNRSNVCASRRASRRRSSQAQPGQKTRGHFPRRLRTNPVRLNTFRRL